MDPPGLVRVVFEQARRYDGVLTFKALSVLPDRRLHPALLSATPAPKRLLPWLVAVAFLMESLDTTVLNTAVPAMARALHESELSMKAVLAS